VVSASQEEQAVESAREEASCRVSTFKKQAVGSALSPPQFKLFASTSRFKLSVSKSTTKQHAAVDRSFAIRHVFLSTFQDVCQHVTAVSQQASCQPAIFLSRFMTLSHTQAVATANTHTPVQNVQTTAQRSFNSIQFSKAHCRNSKLLPQQDFTCHVIVQQQRHASKLHCIFVLHTYSI